MAANKRKTSLLFFLWPATLLAAFFIGRVSSTHDPTAAYEATLESTEAQAKATKALEVKTLRPGSAKDGVTPITNTDPDPLVQIRSAINEGDPLKRMSMLTDAFSRLNKDNIMEGVALLNAMPDGQLRRQMENLLYNTWGKLDGPAAMEYVLGQEQQEGGNPGGRGRGGDRFGGPLRDTMAVMSGWAETDPQAAVAYAADNGSDERGRNMMLMSALQGWANTDIRGAVNYAMTEAPYANDQGPGRGGMESFLINRFVNEDPQAASQWALTQPDPEVRKEAVGTIARSMANSNPEEAALWAQTITDPEAQAEALRGTASGWARQDPETAMNWALNIQDDTSANQAVNSALSTWAREDPYSASDYVINMEAGTEKNTAAATLSRNLAREDPEMAILWAEAITDPTLQTQTVTQITERWMKRAPEKTIEWIQKSSLPEETKQALLARNKQP